MRLPRIPLWAGRFALTAVSRALLVGCADTSPVLELGKSSVFDRVLEGGVVVLEGGSSESGVSEGVACFEYMSAVCERYAQCRFLPAVSEGCLELSRGCRAEFFVEGSTRTPESMVTCASQYADFDCGRLLRGESPACATPGTFAAGAPCAGHMACESAYCDVDSSGERTCYALATSGGECDGRTACPPGEACDQGRCDSISELTLDSGDAPQSAVGQPCYETSYCRQGLYCFFSDQSGLGVCAQPPPAGDPCAGPYGYAPDAQKSICDDASYCSSAGTCEVLPALGERCALRADGLLPVCAAGTFCAPASTICVELKDAGSQCTLTSELSSLSGLPIAPECDPGRGLRCVCDDERDCDAGQGTCRVGVRPGQSCAFDEASCLYGATCSDARICDYR